GPGGRVDALVRVEQTSAGVAVVAAVGPGDLADAAGLDRGVGLPEAVVAGALRADLQDLLRAPDAVAQLDGLLDGVRHRLLDIDVLARLQGVDRDLRVPMVRRGDEDRINIVSVDDLAIVEVAVALARFLSAAEA